MANFLKPPGVDPKGYDKGSNRQTVALNHYATVALWGGGTGGEKLRVALNDPSIALIEERSPQVDLRAFRVTGVNVGNAMLEAKNSQGAVWAFMQIQVTAAVAVEAGAVRFQAIWDNYPSVDQPCIDRKTRKPPSGFDNQCAIRVSVALSKAGVSFASYRGSRCPASTTTGALPSSAQQLADWLKTKPFSGCSAPESSKGSEVFDKSKIEQGSFSLRTTGSVPARRETSARGTISTSGADRA
jgi:hypothetical protein